MSLKSTLLLTVGSALVGAGMGGKKGMETGLGIGIKAGLVAGVAIGIVGTKLMISVHEKVEKKVDLELEGVELFDLELNDTGVEDVEIIDFELEQL